MPDSARGSGETPMTSWTDSVATGGRSVVQSAEEGIGAVGRCTWDFFHDYPYLGGLLGGGLGLSAAMLLGVGELATTVLTAYIGYRVFAYGESVTEALAKSLALRHGERLEEEQRRPSTPE
jgi:hypothetical protein